MRGRSSLALVALLSPHVVSGGAQPAPDGAPETTAPVEVRATSNRDEVTIGEPFIVDVKAFGPAGTTFTFLDEVSTEGFELRSVSAVDPSSASDDAATMVSAPAAPGVHRYEAMVFALGEARIPGIPVRYRLPDGTEGEATGDPLTLKVGSLLPKDEDARTLADVRGPVGATIGRAFWIALALALLAVAAIVYVILRRRRKAQAPAAPSVPEVPPDTEALRALEALAARDLPARGEFRTFYIELTAVAKRYLERRLEAPVVEMTSAETLAFLRGHVHGAQLLPTTRELAEAADKIKFARGDGLADEALRHLSSVRGLVNALEERLRPIVPETEGKAA